MPLQWYPGHMTKARRLIADSMPLQDVVIEVLDARMPLASENPVLAELRRHRPCIKVLSKSDLADPEITKEWIAYFESRVPARLDNGLVEGKVVALALSSSRPADAKTKIPELCKQLALHPSGPGKTVRAMIVGIPNVGKSTLINTLMDRSVAKVGDKPAVTRGQQFVTLRNGMTISDNPGIMWPKIEDEGASYRLAFGGAFPDTAMDYEDVGYFGAEYLLDVYPDALVARYKLKEIPATAEDLLAEIGKRRGALRSGGVVDMHKAADALIHDFRSGALGRISLEAPPDDEESADAVGSLDEGDPLEDSDDLGDREGAPEDA